MALLPLQPIAWLTSEATAINASTDWLGKRADKPVVRNNPRARRLLRAWPLALAQVSVNLTTALIKIGGIAIHYCSVSNFYRRHNCCFVVGHTVIVGLNKEWKK
jgi:hypothetical protein